MKDLPSGRKLAQGRYFFADLVIGDYFETDSMVVDAQLIRTYAEMSGDCYSLHLSDDVAKELGFQSLVAHGILVQGLADGLKYQSSVQLDAIASLGWNIRYMKPVYAGDRISVLVRIDSKKVTSKGDRGIVRLELTVRNQDGLIVQHGFNKLMMRLHTPDNRS